MQAEMIKKMRVAMGLTQEGLGRLLNIGAPTINRWEKGHAKPSRMACDKLHALKKKTGYNESV